MRGRLAVAGVAAMAVSLMAWPASPAAAAPDPWESESGIYHYFSVALADVPSGACGNSAGAGAELVGNIGPSKTWAAVGLDSANNKCVANIGPMEPGLYYYEYVATMADRSKVAFRAAGNPVDVTSHPTWNTLFVPGSEVAWMDDVASGGGRLATLGYTSVADGGARSAAVWTPPSYDAGRAEAYPVLYLLSGDGQSHREWLELGRAQQILDNLAVDGESAEMVVVMVDLGGADHRSELLGAVLPAVRAAYNVASDRQAVAGVGRGGYQALNLAVTDPGLFAAVGSMSGYLPAYTSISSAMAAQINDGTDLIRLYVGNTLDANHNATYDVMGKLDAAGVTYEFDGVNPETGGVWDTWQESLRDFAGRVFQSDADPAMSDGHRDLTEPYTPPAAGSVTTPFIDDDGMVTFETGAQWADANDVVIWGDWAPNGQWFRIPMTKVGDRWRTTIGPIDGYYYWRYEVDGVGVKDPADTTNVENVESQLFVPGGVRTPLLADAPADEVGDVATLTYTGSFGESKLKVWTPPDYDPARAEAYPVVYLYHGMGQNYASWTEVGRATQILDNLYAQGQIVPMVVVMPGFPGIPFDIWDELSGSVMPLIEAEYNVSAEPAKRAMAGLSWGAFLTHSVLVNHPGELAYFGVFSPPFAWASVDAATPAGQTAIDTTRLTTLFAGDVDGGAVGAINGIEANLDGVGIRNVKTIVPGPHGFDVWWQGWIDFLPRLFDTEGPTVTVKEESKGEDGVYSSVSLALSDKAALDKLTLNGVELDLGDVTEFSLDGLAPGVSGAVEGANVLVVHDTWGNTTTLSFILDTTPPTITVDEAAAGTVGTATDGYESVSLTFADEHKVDKFTVNGVETDCADASTCAVDALKAGVAGAIVGDNVIVVHDIAGNTATLTIKVLADSTVAHGFVDGKSVHTKGADTALVWRASIDFSLFAAVVEVDGTPLAAADYEAAAGSTVVTLKSPYLETLDVGQHVLSVAFADGTTLRDSFTVKAASEPLPSAGATVDWWAAFLAALLLLAGGVLLIASDRESRRPALLGPGLRPSLDARTDAAA
jgi:enterochelin esterase-like enzyme